MLQKLILFTIFLMTPWIAYSNNGLFSGGYAHNCAITNGSLRCWGWNYHGQLGNGTTGNAAAPKPVTAFIGQKVTAVSTGDMHSCAVVNENKIYCWGLNLFGQLGDGTRVDKMEPVLVHGIAATAKVTSVAAGQQTTCAVVDGGLKCWGWNYDCLLGRADCKGGYEQKDDFALEPKDLPNFGPGSGFEEVKIAPHHACASRQGGLMCWGDNFEGYTGTPNPGQHTKTPTWVSELEVGTGVTDFALAERHTCAVQKGKARCWGWSKMMGAGIHDKYSYAWGPFDVVGISQVSRISTYGFSTCAIAKKGTYCWGFGHEGQLANGRADTQNVWWTPGKITGLGGTDQVQTILSGTNHHCAIDQTGAKCWGWNVFNQTGNGVYPAAPDRQPTMEPVSNW